MGERQQTEVKWVDDITAVQFRVILYSDY